MTYRNLSGLLLAGSAIAIVAGGAVPAIAQDNVTASDATASNPQDDGAIDEIVVTAQFREQNLQDTPLAITAVTGDMLEAKSASTILDVANSAPNVTMRAGAGNNNGAAQIYIRGIGSGDSSFAFEPAVGTYIDDVYFGTVFGAIFDLLDLDRVEVLRGPQGTLSGRNSIGGAVKLFTKRPDFDNGGYVEATYGRFNRQELKGSANFVLVPDKVMARVSGISKTSDGYAFRYDYGCLYPSSGVPSATAGDCKIGEEGGRDFQAGRLALRILPSDTVEVNLSGMISSDNSQLAPQVLLDIRTQNNIPAGIDPKIFITPRGERYNFANFLNPAFTDPAIYNGVPGAGSHPATALDPRLHLVAKTLSGTVDWELGDNLAIKSITAYQVYNGSNATDIDLTPFPVNLVATEFDYKQFTQELRLNGEIGDGLIDYTVGGFYFKSTGKFGGTNYNLPGLARENIFTSRDRIPSESKSVFAHVTANLTDALSVIGGIRYTDDSKDYYYRRLNPYYPDLTAYTSARLIDGTVGSYKGSHVDYRANVQYRWNPDFMTYAQFSTGYRAGGVNPRPFVIEQAVPFGSEKLDAYEVGFKADLFGRAVRLNGSAFINNYTDIVLSNQQPTPSSNLNATPVNAGSARYKGAELEMNLRPVTDLRIDASVSYLTSRFTKINTDGVTIGISLDEPAFSGPEWKFNTGIQYDAWLPNGSRITPRLDAYYQTAFTSGGNFPQITEKYLLMNGRLTWENANEDLSVSLAVTNLLDKYYNITTLNYPVGVTIGSPSAPREWRVSVRKSF